MNKMLCKPHSDSERLTLEKKSGKNPKLATHKHTDLATTGRKCPAGTRLRHAALVFLKFEVELKSAKISKIARLRHRMVARGSCQ